MAKLTKQSLSRGVRLNVEHVFNLLSSIKSIFQNATIEKENIENNKASFRIFLNIPFVDYSTFETDDKNAILIPFIIPPFQDLFDSKYIQRNDLPKIWMKEVSFSFDQRDEAAAIGGVEPNAFAGFMTGRTDSLTINLAILEKTPYIVDNNKIYPENQILSFQIDPLAYGGASFRINPFTLDQLSIPINPYKTYIVSLNAPDLADYDLALPSATIVMKFECELVPRDIYDGIDVILQNNFTDGDYDTNTSLSTLVSPSAGEVIKADSSKGLSFSAKLLDNFLIKKIRGGFATNGDRQINEMIRNDASLDVIAVPLFQGFRSVRAGDVATEALPKCSGPGFVSTADTRVIVLNHPFTIHHIFWAQSFISPESAALGHAAPGSHHQDPNMVFECGVAACAGLKQDMINDQQIAYLSVTGPMASSYLVDKVKQKVGSLLSVDTSADVLLYQVPLVCDVSRTGKGFTENGYPFFVARGTSKTQSRFNAGIMPFDFGGGVFHSPYTVGQETFLKVRAKISDSTNPGGLSTHASNPAANTIIGDGGHWVFIIGKKTLI